MNVPLSLKRAWRLQRGGASALIVLTLAVTLGAATAVLTLADALLFRAVPYTDPGRLARITAGFPRIRVSGMGLSGPEALELAEITRAFSAVGAVTFSTPAVETGESPVPAESVEVSRGAFDALAIRPAAGRGFAPGDFQSGAAPVVMLGAGLFERAFGAQASAIGRVLVIDGARHEIVGIIPAGATLLGRAPDVWRPLPLGADNAGGRSDHRFTVIGRVRPELTLDDAAADVARAESTWLEEFGEPHSPSPTMHPLTVESLASATTGVRREPVTALVAACVFLLLIACANVSLLLASRAEQRRGDIAVQWALGAGSRALAADAAAEGALLSVAGGLLGIGVAAVMLRTMQATWPVLADIDLGIDVTLLSLAAGLTAVAALITGLLPILGLRRARAAEWLRAGARGQGAGRQRIQRFVIAGQIALALMLSSGAGLLIRSLSALGAVETGIAADGVLQAQITLPDAVFQYDTQVYQFYDDVLARVARLPGVTSAAAMSGLPPLRRANNSSFLLDGVATMSHDSIRQIEFIQHVSGPYFETMGIPLKDGRVFTAADDERGARVAIVNDTLARRFWPGQSAVGHTIIPAGFKSWFTVVGVVADVAQDGLTRPPGAEIYVPHRQARMLFDTWIPSSLHIVVQTSGGHDQIGGALREIVAEVHPAAALSDVAMMDEVVARTIAEPRVLAWVLAAFAMVGLIVACAGVFAVTSYAAGTRTAEFGLRMAIGASPRDVLLLVLRGGVGQTLAGAAAGIAGALAGGHLLQGLLFKVEPVDFVSLASASLAICLAALAATLLPAARAARVDPLIALRDP